MEVTKPAKTDKDGKVIVVNLRSESIRVVSHIDYISRNGKIELETNEGQVLGGKSAAVQLAAEWLVKHDEDCQNDDATDRTRVTSSMVFSMPDQVNAERVKDAVRSLTEDEFGGRHDYVMAMHTDTKHPDVHLTVRTVGHDGIKLNLRNGFASEGLKRKRLRATQEALRAGPINCRSIRCDRRENRSGRARRNKPR